MGDTSVYFLLGAPTSAGGSLGQTVAQRDAGSSKNRRFQQFRTKLGRNNVARETLIKRFTAQDCVERSRFGQEEGAWPLPIGQVNFVSASPVIYTRNTYVERSRAACFCNHQSFMHKLAAQVERMTPEEAAEYLAKIGAGHVLLRKLRELLKEIEGIDKEDVKGLLSAFLSVINSVAESIQILIDQMNEMAELQESVVHADKEGRSNRRRFKL